MERHVEAGYLHSEDRDLVCINDWIRAPAPAFWLGGTGAGFMWRFRTDVTVDLRKEIERLCGTEPAPEDPPHLPKHDGHYRRLLSAVGVSSEPVTGPTYALAAAAYHAEGLELISEANHHLLRNGLDAWIPDVPHQQPMVAYVIDQRAVSICASVRITLQAHAAGVETLHEFRGHGYASAAVSGWAHHVQRLRCIPMYSTSWDNHGSQAVARRVGFERFGQEYRLG